MVTPVSSDFWAQRLYWSYFAFEKSEAEKAQVTELRRVAEPSQ